jgi:hypothetical protein
MKHTVLPVPLAFDYKGKWMGTYETSSIGHCWSELSNRDVSHQVRHGVSDSEDCPVSVISRNVRKRLTSKTNNGIAQTHQFSN